MNESKNRGYKSVKLHTVDIDYQKIAHKMYESLGFQMYLREPKREIGHDRLYYVYRLWHNPMKKDGWLWKNGLMRNEQVKKEKESEWENFDFKFFLNIFKMIY